MESKTKQNWTAGATVKVGFLTLLVVAKIATPGDGLLDAYILASKTAFYEFVPHNGLNRITEQYAREQIAAEKARAIRIAADAVHKAIKAARHTAAISQLTEPVFLGYNAEGLAHYRGDFGL